MGRTRTVMIKESKRRKIELEVNPSEFSVSESMNNTTVNISELGTVNIPGNRGLKEISISTFLPASRSPFYGGESVKSIMKLIERWKENKTVVRIIVSGDDINMRALVESTTETYKEGQKDVYINWKFRQYRGVYVPTVQSVAGMIAVQDPALEARPEEGQPAAGGTTITADSKTTLWGLAVKYYQDGTQWTKIAAANNNIDPKKIQIGMELIIP